MGLASAGITTELREIVLRDKAPAFLEASPKGTVPVLVTPQGEVIEESFDVMMWALLRCDPEGLLDGPMDDTRALIDANDGPFKTALDRYKYANRYEDADPKAEREMAVAHLARLDTQLGHKDWLFGPQPRLADLAILPFVRQFAFVDKPWFDAQPMPSLQRWLAAFLTSDRFGLVFAKYPKWAEGDVVTRFPG